MLSKFKILLVDDDPDKRQLLRFALEDLAGFSVLTANDGVEGLAAVKSQQIDLVITDVMMPRMDGFELARCIRANPQTRFIPIIIQTAARGTAHDLRQGAEAGALGYITDPTDLDLLIARAHTLLDFKNYLDSCEEAAFIDHLTGLANRRRFERQLAREASRTQRYGRPFCLLLVDVDLFKDINDTYGHEVGDEALRQLGSTLQVGTRGIDTAARIGGDEFAVILTETDYDFGLEVAERLRLAIKQIRVPDGGRAITASLGLAECSHALLDGRELVAAADAALYEAKRQGRDRVVGHTPAAPEEANSSPARGVSTRQGRGWDEGGGRWDERREGSRE